MPDSPVSDPWRGFLSALDGLLASRAELICLGGFVMTTLYGAPRQTGDIDCLEIRPSEEARRLERLAGPGSELSRKHGLYVQRVGIITLPDSYEDRLRRIYPNSYPRLALFGVDPYDLALSKLDSNREVDQMDVAHLAKSVPLNTAILTARYRNEMRPYLPEAKQRWLDQTLELWIEEFFE